MQTLIKGRGSFPRLPELAAALGIRHPLVVCGLRMTEKLRREIPSLGNVPVFSGYQPNPNYEDALAGAKLYRLHDCDGLISIGGGSAMDTAKAVKAILLAGTPEAALSYEFSSEVIPHAAVPGTAGTGAEATPFAVVYRNRKKHSLSHPALLPEGVLLDASLLDTLPAYHRSSCAMDALAQGLESYWATGATEESRPIALQSMAGVAENLKAYLAGDPAAADAMLTAAYDSGRAIAFSRTTAAHAMSYELTKHFGIAHGHACMLTLPVLWSLAQEQEQLQPCLAAMTRVLKQQSPTDVPELLYGMLLASGLTIPAYGDETLLDALVATVNPERLGNHPMKLSAEELKDVYRRALTPLTDKEQAACLARWEQYANH